jgi:hypothetical protein
MINNVTTVLSFNVQVYVIPEKYSIKKVIRLKNQNQNYIEIKNWHYFFFDNANGEIASYNHLQPWAELNG